MQYQLYWGPIWWYVPRLSLKQGGWRNLRVDEENSRLITDLHFTSTFAPLHFCTFAICTFALLHFCTSALWKLIQPPAAPTKAAKKAKGGQLGRCTGEVGQAWQYASAQADHQRVQDGYHIRFKDSYHWRKNGTYWRYWTLWSIPKPKFPQWLNMDHCRDEFDDDGDDHDDVIEIETKAPNYL